MLSKLRIPIILMALSMTSTVHAVPTLQVGVPGGVGEGAYGDYQGSTFNPVEEDTAITNGNSLFVAGVYKPNTRFLGGQFSGGDNWSDFGYDSSFDTRGAVLLAAVPDGTLSAADTSLTINGLGSFFRLPNLGSLFPNRHDPLKDDISDFLFYDIGDFAKNSGAVPNFADETGAADGEIKTLTIAGASGLDWIHFDVLALETRQQGGGRFRTSLANNPGSHDVTWNQGGGGLQQIPEPSVLALFGVGFLGLGFFRRYRLH
ncbi:glycosyl transferase family 1 [Nitrosococcus oceani]|nr:glycosyl transferase family 1 [Nitrosococcus oceani]